LFTLAARPRALTFALGVHGDPSCFPWPACRRSLDFSENPKIRTYLVLKSLTARGAVKRMDFMNILSTRSLKNVTAVLAAALITIPSFAQTTSPAPKTKAPARASDTAKPAAPAALSATGVSTTASSPATTSAQPNEAEMMKQMMELAKPGENHKLLATLAGTWSYDVTMWMNPGAPPTKSTGTAVRKAIMDGRYFSLDVAGKMKMPGADGKMKDMEFKGMGIEGYDNAKKKFVATWCDNMGTGFALSEGSYDAATKTFTYTGDYEMMPGMKTKFREVIKLADANHHSFEYYEDRGAGEAKTMEINYTRKK
jgi:hypothetical protein